MYTLSTIHGLQEAAVHIGRNIYQVMAGKENIVGLLIVAEDRAVEAMR